MKQLVKAVLGVMQDIKGIEKKAKVGSGSHAYDGVKDQDVKKSVGDAMVKHGLVIFPISIEAEAETFRWTEQNNGYEKQRQSVVTKVDTKYLLVHESGESQEIVGYGHGVDSQDKSAGKATTYALKYALLYTFMVATGSIDDTDTTHSNDIETPKNVQTTKSEAKPVEKQKLIKDSDLWLQVINRLEKNPSKISMALLEEFYDIRETEKQILQNQYFNQAVG